MRKLVAILLLAACASIALAGCGKSNNNSGNNGTTFFPNVNM